MYYYFAASLPLIWFEGKLPFSVESFLEDCRRLLSEGDYALMERLLAETEEDSQTGHTVFDEWIKFRHSFRNESAWFRSAKLSKDPSRHIRGLRFPEARFAEVIHQAAKAGNPLEAQRQLDRFQWEFLDELSAGHDYDIEFLFGYALKLRILQRYQEYASEKGLEVFKELKETELPESCLLHAEAQADSGK